MCGIIGISSKTLVKENLIKCLSNLEYRGYDSVGIYLNELIKTKGMVSDLVKILPSSLDGKTGLGHSRWATHGLVNNDNAHPFISYHQTFILVHNGIINNYQEIKDELILHGYIFHSDTDSEVVCNLLDCYYEKYHDSLKALELTLKQISGTYAFGIINCQEPQKIYFAKKESPLVIGTSDLNNFIVSDINSSNFLTDKFIILKDEQYGYIDNEQIKIYQNQKEIQKEIIKINRDNYQINKGEYAHFMLKEINEEPLVLRRILQTYTSDNKITIDSNLINDLKNSQEINILGCGTSYHAGLIGKHVIERLTKKRVNVYLASDFNNLLFFEENSTYLLLTQSGETMDLKLAYNRLPSKDKVYTFTNVLTSSLALISKASFSLCAGVEVAVASTKAYISEVAILIMLAYKLIDLDELFIQEINKSINSIENTLNKTNQIKELAHEINDSKSLFFLGRGIDHLINLENSLKLKEVTYIHSEAIYGGELKHGSIALISNDINVLGLISNENNLNPLLSNIKEVESRNANVNIISTSNLNLNSKYLINNDNELFSPLVIAPFFQLLSYYVGLANKRDIDKPRNLAKSCTVE